MPYSNLQPVSACADPAGFPPRRFPPVADTASDPQSLQRLLEESDETPSAEWTEEDIVRLHCLLLDDLAALADPRTPLEEKFDTLRWVFTDPDKDGRPFSFASCLHVAGCSPLSTYPYFGLLDVNDVRDMLLGPIKRWLRESLDRYPDWIRDAIARNPQWASERLSKNPQWINEQIKNHAAQGDLFS
jgi:hypothetical protein